jgi:hypothetical protein
MRGYENHLSTRKKKQQLVTEQAACTGVPILSMTTACGLAQQRVPVSEGPAEVQKTHKNLENIEEKTVLSCNNFPIN